MTIQNSNESIFDKIQKGIITELEKSPAKAEPLINKAFVRERMNKEGEVFYDIRFPGNVESIGGYHLTLSPKKVSLKDRKNNIKLLLNPSKDYHLRMYIKTPEGKYDIRQKRVSGKDITSFLEKEFREFKAGNKEAKTDVKESNKTADLAYGSLGSGITVWDKNSKTDQDYETIAYIPDKGKGDPIFYQDVTNELKEEISDIAVKMREEKVSPFIPAQKQEGIMEITSDIEKSLYTVVLPSAPGYQVGILDKTGVTEYKEGIQEAVKQFILSVSLKPRKEESVILENGETRCDLIRNCPQKGIKEIPVEELYNKGFLQPEIKSWIQDCDLAGVVTDDKKNRLGLSYEDYLKRETEAGNIWAIPEKALKVMGITPTPDICEKIERLNRESGYCHSTKDIIEKAENAQAAGRDLAKDIKENFLDKQLLFNEANTNESAIEETIEVVEC